MTGARASVQGPFVSQHKEVSPWQQVLLTEVRAGSATDNTNNTAPIVQEGSGSDKASSIMTISLHHPQQQRNGESSSIPILSNIYLLAKLAKDIQSANSQALAMPTFATQQNDTSAIGIWASSSGVLANGVQSIQPTLDTCVSSSYQTEFT